MQETNCYHCGDLCEEVITFSSHSFCCNGCKMVFEILHSNNLGNYYDLEKNPGTSQKNLSKRFDFLENEEIVSKLLEFDDEETQIVHLFIPNIHCSSCIWVLENLQKLHPLIIHSEVNFPQKKVRITYHAKGLDLKSIAVLLDKIGYAPYISSEDNKSKKKRSNKLLLQLVWAGFAFGNVMLMSFPEYFEVKEFWLESYKPFFRLIMVVFTIPVVFYSASDYFISAYKGLKNKILNIDVPISLGIIVLFGRSLFEIVTDSGQGYWDSLNGLVFFLLLGKYFQQRTYSFLSFDRDYNSYFPIGVTKILDDTEENIPIDKIAKGDILLIRNEEIIPVDGILSSEKASFDYSFVTGESRPLFKVKGDKIFAGGKQLSGTIEMEVTKDVSQSYLTQLWSKDTFQTKTDYLSFTDRISKYFTIVVLIIALVTGVYWYFTDASLIMDTVTSVLIVACPCALALSAPFALGNMLRLFGKDGFYLKDGDVIEKIADVDTVVFDKTGTLSYSSSNTISYEGEALELIDKRILKSTLRISNHPLSRGLYAYFDSVSTIDLETKNEVLGQGLVSVYNKQEIRLGNIRFVSNDQKAGLTNEETVVYYSVDGTIKGKFVFSSKYRQGLKELFDKLNEQGKEIHILSGDNANEEHKLRAILPENVFFSFNKKPDQKLNYIQNLQKQGKNVLMLGDGLNDAGALKQSNIGVAISENINVFSPACDGILSAEKFKKLAIYIGLSNKTKSIITISFIFSILYNIVGVCFAVIGKLSPVVSAILMPLSSITIVTLVTVLSYLIFHKR